MKAGAAPAWIAGVLNWNWTWRLARLALASPFLIGGFTKLLDYPGAVAEMERFGLAPARVWAALAIVVEVGGSVLVVAGRHVWLGAGGLGVLTAVAMLAANDFWAATGHERLTMLNAFFEHLGLVAGLVLVSIRALEARP